MSNYARLLDPALHGRLWRSAGRSREGRDWLKELPQQLERYLDRWDLCLDLPPGSHPWSGYGAVVVPVRRADESAAVLKLSFPHDEARTEAAGLAMWADRGAVRLLKADPQDFALLLERLDADRSLLQLPMDEAVAVWGRLMRRLSLPAGGTAGEQACWAQFDTVAGAAERMTDEIPAEWEQLGRPFGRWLLECALEICQLHGAVGRRASRDVLLHSDLHYENVLAGPVAAQYAAIDPKPLVGDAEFALAPMLWNRIGDLSRADPAAALLSRCDDLAEAAGLDRELARAWSIVREVQNALGYVGDGLAGDAQRSLWVATSLAGRRDDSLPPAHALPIP